MKLLEYLKKYNKSYSFMERMLVIDNNQNFFTGVTKLPLKVLNALELVDWHNNVYWVDGVVKVIASYTDIKSDIPVRVPLDWLLDSDCGYYHNHPNCIDIEYWVDNVLITRHRHVDFIENYMNNSTGGVLV